MLNECDIKDRLQTDVFGRKEIHIFEQIDSTNSSAHSLAESSSPEGTIVLAESQSSGKGRLGRKWISVAGKSLSVSIIMRPDIDISKAPGLTLAIAVALSDTLHSFGVHTHRIKWPNDILIKNKKISGILTEMKATPEKILFIIAGIGINISSIHDNLPDDIKDIASSVYDETGLDIDRTDFLCSFLLNLEKRYNEFLRSGLEHILNEWRENSDIIGSTVTVSINRNLVKGKVTGINYDGSLNLETDSGIVHINSGEIHL